MMEEIEPVRGKILFAGQYFQLLGGRRTVEWREPRPAVWSPGKIEDAYAKMESSPELGTSQQFTALVNPHDADGMGATTSFYFGSQVVAPGQRTPIHRHNTETLYLLTRGNGFTDLVSPGRTEKTRIAWDAGDPFMVFTCPPHWWHAHENTGTTVMRIWAVQNIPELARRGILAFDEGSGYQPVGTGPAPQADRCSEEPQATHRERIAKALADM